MSARHTARTVTAALAAMAICVLGACDRKSTVPKPKAEPPAPSASTPMPTLGGTTAPSAK